MITKIHSRQAFFRELKALLEESGITPHRLPISAEVNNREHRFDQESDKSTKIGKVIIYIEEHLSEKLSLKKMAEEAQLSKYQLVRKFRAETGSTPWRYLIDRRIERAKRLLEQGVPPGQAAVDAGFYDQSHLNKIFREETEVTPREYQEKHFINRN